MRTLQWHEPAFYRRAIARRWNVEYPREALKFAVLAFVAILVIRYMSETGKPNPNLPGWPKVVALAAFFAWVFAYALPWLILRLPNSIVILSPKGVNNNVVGKGVGITFWPWSDISYFTYGGETIDDRPVRTVSLHGSDDRVLATFGMTAKPTFEDLEECLKVYGKPLRIEVKESANRP